MRALDIAVVVLVSLMVFAAGFGSGILVGFRLGSPQVFINLDPPPAGGPAGAGFIGLRG